MSDNLGGTFNPKKVGLATKNLEYLTRKAMNKKKLCWKCQKDKSTYGGFLKIQPGLHKFICKECCDAKKAKDESSSGD